MLYRRRLIVKIILLCTVLVPLSFLSARPVYSAQTLSPEDIIKLKEAGVSDEVIIEMIKRGKEEEGRVREFLAPITIHKMHSVRQKDADTWIMDRPKMDLSEATFVALMTRFAQLMLPTAGAMKEDLWDKFLIVNKNGKRCFVYGRIVYEKKGTNDVTQYFSGMDETATWENKVTGKSYRLRIEGDRIIFTQMSD